MLFKGACALASQIVVLGDGRSYCTALITLDEDALTPVGEAPRRSPATYAELDPPPRVQAEVGRGDRRASTRG